MREERGYDRAKIERTDGIGFSAGGYAGEHQRGRCPGSWGTGTGLHTPQHDRRADQPESVPGKKLVLLEFYGVDFAPT